MVKKIFAFVVVFVMASGLSYAQQSSSTSEEGMAFEHGSVAEIFAIAKAQNKYIFVDCFADWCGPCKWMAANVFPQKEVGEFYNSNFVSYKFDMEKGEGPDFAKQYNVTSYPRYLYFSPDGELVHMSGGSKEAEKFIQDGMNALNPEMTLYGLQTKYESGDRSPQTLMNYANALWNANQKGNQAIGEEYLKTQDESELTSADNWQMIERFVWNVDGREFKYLEANKATFASLYGEKEVSQKINNTYINHFFTSKDFEAYAEYVEKLDINNNWGALNEHAWNMYEGTDNKDLLKMAAKWAKRSMELEQNYYNTDTYASILYKLGEYKESEKYADLAIELAKKNNQKYDGTLELKQMLKIKRKD